MTYPVNNLPTSLIKQLFFYFCSGRPGGGTGRHAGLKILWPLRLYGFDSRPGYVKGFSSQENPFLFLAFNPGTSVPGQKAPLPFRL